MVLKPWITSRAISKGMPKRDSSIATRCKALTRTGSTSFLRAYPKLRHGEKHRSLDELRERLKYERRH